MPRNSEDLSADYYIDENDQPPEAKKKLSKKQKNYIIGFSITGVLLIAIAVIYYFAATVWLVDYTTLGYLTYAYEIDSDEASVVRINLESDYPENFRIPAKVKGRTITKIEDGAFRDATRLKSVTMTDNIVSIGSEAFKGCTNLESINFSNNIDYIGVDAFQNTYYFDNLPDDELTLIDDILLRVGINYFEPNTILVNDEDSYEALDDKYKGSNYNVKYWDDMPEVRVWMNGLFANNENLVYVEMPSFFEEIPANSFQNCYNLIGIGFPDNVKSIGDYCFAGCYQLVDGNLPNTLTSIGDYAFQETSTQIPTDLSHCEKIGVGAFQDCSGVSSIIYPELSSISNYCFDGCYNLTDFKFANPDSITLIGTAAFRGTGIESFVVPQHVTDVRDYTFSSCPELTTVYLYNNTTNTGLITEYTITWEEEDPETGEMVEKEETSEIFTADGVQNIRAYAFANSPKFNTLSLFDVDSSGQVNYDNIENYKEEGVINLPVTLISTNNSNGSTAGYSFTGTAVSKVNFNYGVTTIGQFLFRYVTTLVSVNIASNEEGNYTLNSIGESAFDGCTNLKEINFPTSLTSIGTSAFRNCSSLTEALLGDTKTTSVPINCFSGCSSISEATISRSATRIYQNAYDGVVSLKEIIIPSNVTTINADAFVNETDEEHSDNLNIYMEHTQADYDKSNYFATGWFDPDCCNVYHYSEEEPTEDMKPSENFSGYWHYDESGNATIW